MHIKEFQELMRDLYYERDNKRGMARTFMWLCEEVGELSKSINKIKIDEDKGDIANEFADVFAWLCSLANILDIDLETASLKKYDNRCPKCDSNPCVCEFK
ncbi:MAG: nucleotide pyrophosphohydrolase [Candidatus Lokiarchaeota archaeon]|nr:nucleotide pyrophosphohydrolase [Candidatus Lokiarchaeota archaeon]